MEIPKASVNDREMDFKGLQQAAAAWLPFPLHKGKFLQMLDFSRCLPYNYIRIIQIFTSIRWEKR